MNAIQIQGITAEEFIEKLKQELPISAPTTQADDGNWTVDRGFLMRNLKMSKRRIEQYEAEGVLKKIALPSDLKGVYYRLSNVRAVREEELNRLYPNR